MQRSLARWFFGMAAVAAGGGMVQADSEVPVNGFACSLYATLAEHEENLFFSPLSLTTALAMTAEGARGETAAQMGDVLGLGATTKRNDPQRPYDWSPVHAGLASLADRLAPRPPPAPLLAQLVKLRAKLDQENAALHAATTFDMAYEARRVEAQRLADEINRLQKQVDPTEFRSANALWLERSFALEAPYLETIARHYKTGGAMPVDFRGDPEAGRKTINDWVGAQTNQRIRDLLQSGMVDESTRLVLTNAVYFLGEWLEPFDATRTKREKFFLRDGSSVDVSLMHARKTEDVKYGAFNADGSPFPTPLRVPAGNADTSGRYPDAGFQIVELPYRGGALSMQAILPIGPKGLSQIETLLNDKNLDRWTAALESRKVDVALPKFKLEASFELSETLQHLGMRRAFVPPEGTDSGAQFHGMSASNDPTQRLYIGAVVHKAFVQVDEKGTEAAAATAVSMLAGAAAPTMVDFTPVFRADRSFVFLIRDRHTGSLLFLGRLVRPQLP